jgi:hypothetical protein
MMKQWSGITTKSGKWCFVTGFAANSVSDAESINQN